LAILSGASMSNRRYLANKMNRFFDFTHRQITFVALLSGTALVLGGYLFIRTHAWPTGDTPRLPVIVSDGSSVYTGTFVLDPNTAPVDSLELIPRVGPSMADAIVMCRDTLRFESLEDLLNVHGIGEKTLEHIRPYLKVVAP